MGVFKKALYLVAFLLLTFVFLGFFSTQASAQSPTPEPDPCVGNPQAATSTTTSFGGAEFSTVPALECIDESEKNKIVEITFHDLTPKTKYVLCAGHKLCLAENGVLEFALPDGSIIKDDIPSVDSSTGDLTVKVCGDGPEKLKTKCDGTVYFWGGNIYMFSIGVLTKNGTYIPSKRGAFYVSKIYPNVVIPSQRLTVNSTLSVEIGSGGNLRPGGGRRNNYQIAVSGPEGYYAERCVTLKQNQGFQKASFDGTTVDKDLRATRGLKVGKYAIFIKEQVDEKSGIIGDITEEFKVGFSLDNPLKGLANAALIPFKIGVDVFDSYDKIKNGCQGGFTYIAVTCDVTNVNKGGGSCTDPKLGKDPKGEEYKAFLRDLAALNKVNPGIVLPCTVREGGDCKSINTAIGPINVTPQGFIETLFEFVLGLAGIGAIIIIIYSGYMLIISQGDKEKIAGARETITSAIVGLLFIILSIVILEIIGVDILKIPGLGR